MNVTDTELSRISAELVGKLRSRGISLHSVLVTRSGRTVYEKYAEPFTENTPHRMYSVTKSFVAAAVGALTDEGKLKLSDRVADFFPDKLPENPPKEILGMTVRDMLRMKTCFAGINWFRPGVSDRTAYYFAQKPVKPAGTVFYYDSNASYVLGALVERLSGMSLLSYMKLRFLDEIGGFENAEMLTTPDGTAWGDSALICTPRALERFARFVLRKGEWNGRQLVSRGYMEEAVSHLGSCNSGSYAGFDGDGYGYYVWNYRDVSFSFEGMGGQQAIVFPKEDVIFVCTGDNQHVPHYYEALYSAVFGAFAPDCVRDEQRDVLELDTAPGASQGPLEARLNGKSFVCEENPMGISRFRLDFSPEGGEFVYENAQGKKVLPFGRKKNVFCGFPQFGYSDGRGNVHENTGFTYRCAVSAAWTDPDLFQIKVQVIDRYFGTLHILLGFRDENVCGIRMTKAAEDFFSEYNGWAIARAE